MYYPFNYPEHIFGLFDSKKNEWILDCFDDPHVFFSTEEAISYQGKCITYEDSQRFLVKEINQKTWQPIN